MRKRHRNIYDRGPILCKLVTAYASNFQIDKPILKKVDLGRTGCLWILIKWAIGRNEN